MTTINHFKSILAGLGMCLLAFNVSAYPQLTFDGRMTYNLYSKSGLLNVEGTLTRSQDISLAPQLQGSIFEFGGQLATTSTNSGVTRATFTGLNNGPDLRVVNGDSGSTVLLEGDLTGLLMRGANGSNMGILSAQFSPTGGSLLNEFVVGAKLFAFQLNLTRNFGPAMFGQGESFGQGEFFAGNVDGKLSAPASVSVPEPGVLILLMLGLGLGLLVISPRKKFGQKFSHHVS
ncbi:MAG TPA: PEP-CTERM sorting domain-containing protein [Gammaproteobacteria bacterium]|nr:PEP-CTERM sorting domain-containing protein [Gammaproteobacteria bacterium]